VILAGMKLPVNYGKKYRSEFANIYSEVADALQSRIAGTQLDMAVDFPTVEDGVRGVEFIVAAVASSDAGGEWVSL
jgi:hypothetical protein